MRMALALNNQQRLIMPLNKETKPKKICNTIKNTKPKQGKVYGSQKPASMLDDEAIIYIYIYIHIYICVCVCVCVCVEKIQL